MSLTARIAAAAPRPVRVAMVRTQFEVRHFMRRARQARFAIEEWITARRPDWQPGQEKQRYDSLVQRPSRVPSFEELEAAERRADDGYVSDFVRFANGVLRRDGHLRGLHEQRPAAIAKEWNLVPGGDRTARDEDAATFVRDAIRHVGEDTFRAHLTNQATSDSYGYSATEIDYERRDGAWVWKSLAAVEQEHFYFATSSTWYGTDATYGELLLSIDGAQPQRLIPGKWVVTTRRLPVRLSQQGLLTTALWWSVIKLRAASNLSASEAAAGLPIPYVRIPDEDLPEEQKASYEALIARAGEGVGAILYGGAEMDWRVVDNRSAAQERTMVQQLCNDEMSKLYQAGTLLNDADGHGSYALGDKQEGRYLERIVHAALRIQADNERQLFRPLLDANGYEDAATPELRLLVLPTMDAQSYVELAIKMQQDLGFPVSEQQMREMTALRRPGKGDQSPVAERPSKGEA